MSNTIIVHEFPIISYQAGIALQKASLERKILERDVDVLLSFEHHATITFGLRADCNDILVSGEKLRELGIEVHWADRGGKTTFHAPGQAVFYPIIDLRKAGFTVSKYIDHLELCLLETLESFGIGAFKSQHDTGLWMSKTEKIASIGVKVRERIAFHGCSINVNLKDNLSRYLVVCGHAETKMVSITDYNPSITLQDVKDVFYSRFSSVFGMTVQKASTEETRALYGNTGSLRLA